MKKLLLFSLILFLASCTQDYSGSKYLRWVGDSKHNPEIDTTDFEICNSEYLVQQYFHFDQGLKYQGEKRELKTIFQNKYIPVKTNQSGWIRIRFIVNCKGETGRFRMTSSDLDYKEQLFDKRIKNQLLEITQALDGWHLHSKRDKPQDYYQYLIFKIDNGNLIEIMP